MQDSSEHPYLDSMVCVFFFAPQSECRCFVASKESRVGGGVCVHLNVQLRGEGGAGSGHTAAEIASCPAPGVSL